MGEIISSLAQGRYMAPENPAMWRPCESQITLLRARRYLCYRLGYRVLEKMLAGPGLYLEHTTP
jgi:hypothetical protein